MPAAVANRRTHWTPTRGSLTTAAALALLACCATPVRDAVPRPTAEVSQERYAAVAAQLERAILHELDAKGLPALSIALVDGGQVVWAAGFGTADPRAGVPASADTVYRVGSVSKLFTDIAMMQLVEQGVLDLDAPVARYLTGFSPTNPFEGEITLRRLTSHRAGLVREPPVGNYFEDSEPTLAETVASLSSTTLACAPGTRTKYSNAGIAVVGAVLEEYYRRPYADLMHARVLRPMGMDEAGFEPTSGIEHWLAKARMWGYDGREYDAPTFQLGMAPAGSLYASVRDLAQFLKVVFADGVGPRGRLLAGQTLERMMTPTPGPDGAPTRFGIGFAIDELDGHRRCGHGGAIYGFSTALTFLPDERLGAVVASSMDVSNSVTSRLGEYALRAMLAAREGSAPPDMPLSKPLPAGRAARLAGRYQAEDGATAELVRHADDLTLEWHGQIAAVRELQGGLVVDDRHTFGTRLVESQDGSLEIAGTRYRRVPSERPAPCPERWRDLLGEYGWDHNVLFVRERAGRLEALIEWFWFDALTELAPDEFALPTDRGLYPLERLTFRRDAEGNVTHAVLGEVAFARRETGAAGETFKIEPLLSTAELHARSRAASAPRERGSFRAPDLVDLARSVPGIRLDVRYATTDNFMSTVFYPAARAFLQRPAAAALARVQTELAGHGYGLVIFDAYRPWHVTKMFWDATPQALKHFVADPNQGSRHNRGCAVDLSLVDLATGEPATMPSGYDEFSERAYPNYPGGTSRERWQRGLLRAAMERNGFQVYDWEWWHYDFDGWREYPILDVAFEEIDGR